LTWTRKLSDQLKLANEARKKLKQTKASAPLIQYRLKTDRQTSFAATFTTLQSLNNKNSFNTIQMPH